VKKLYFLFAIIIVLSCHEKEETMIHKDGYYWFLTYGFPDFQREEFEKTVNKKWKIKTVRVAGCVVTQELMDSVRSENKKTNLALQKRYGKNWKDLYDKDIQDYTMKQVDIMDVLITNKVFRKELAKHKIEIDDLDKDAEELGRPEFYKVNINKIYPENGIAFTVNVDLKNRTVNLIK